MMHKTRGAWHGKTRYFGMHYDLHAGPADLELGKRCAPNTLIPSLKRMRPQFVQTDCKGHAGYVSWFSQTPTATLPPALKHDALARWRAATKQLDLPLHCHYSGIWDKAAGAKFPDWAVVGPDGAPTGAPFGQNAGAPTPEKMCPRGPYLDQLMIPQMLELIDRYEVDGFWIDGDLWSCEPCYCSRCTTAYRDQYGAEPPTALDHPDWSRWWNFTREAFEAYVTRYCDAVHAHKPGVLVCSNWLQTFRNPGEPRVPTDWISGDNSWIWGLDGSRCEARFLSTRSKPWDIMLWAFYCTHGMGKPDSPWTAKPAEMLMQEAACIIAEGGHVQIYENPSPLRDGALIPWRMDILGEVGRFVKQRRKVCQGTRSVPQVAVLHSEAHVRSTTRGKNLMWAVDTDPVRGAVFALLEAHASVDIHDEWSLAPVLELYPCVVVPEQHALSDSMVAALKAYVRAGGHLLLTGAEIHERFGPDFIGATPGQVETDRRVYVGENTAGARYMVPLFSRQWRLMRARPGVRTVGLLGETPLAGERHLPHPACVINSVGAGQVAYIPAAICRDFGHNRYPHTRQFLAEVLRILVTLDLQVDAPLGIDVSWRQTDDFHVIHLLNRLSGLPNAPSAPAIDEIPPVGPIELRLPWLREPRAVTAACEDADMVWYWDHDHLTIRIHRVHIHEAITIS